MERQPSGDTGAYIFNDHFIPTRKSSEMEELHEAELNQDVLEQEDAKNFDTKDYYPHTINTDDY